MNVEQQADLIPALEWWDTLSSEDKTAYTQLRIGVKRSYQSLSNGEISLIFILKK